jgi:hypothetical protein
MTRKFSFNVPAITLWIWASWTLFTDISTWYNTFIILLRGISVLTILCLVYLKVDLVSFKEEEIVYAFQSSEAENDGEYE